MSMMREADIVVDDRTPKRRRFEQARNRLESLLVLGLVDITGDYDGEYYTCRLSNKYSVSVTRVDKMDVDGDDYESDWQFCVVQHAHGNDIWYHLDMDTNEWYQE
jgi:hypothetical protein